MRKVRLLCGKKNSEKILFLYLATIQLGAKVLGINPAFPQENIAKLCEFYQIDFVFMIKILLNLQEIGVFTQKPIFFSPSYNDAHVWFYRLTKSSCA